MKNSNLKVSSAILLVLVLLSVLQNNWLILACAPIGVAVYLLAVFSEKRRNKVPQHVSDHPEIFGQSAAEHFINPPKFPKLEKPDDPDPPRAA